MFTAPTDTIQGRLCFISKGVLSYHAMALMHDLSDYLDNWKKLARHFDDRISGWRRTWNDFAYQEASVQYAVGGGNFQITKTGMIDFNIGVLIGQNGTAIDAYFNTRVLPECRVTDCTRDSAGLTVLYLSRMDYKNMGRPRIEGIQLC